MERIDIERLTIRYRGVEVQRARQSIVGLGSDILRGLADSQGDGSEPGQGRIASGVGDMHAGHPERTVSALRRRTADAVVREVRTKARRGGK